MNKGLKKTFAILFLLLLMLSSSPRPAHADIWGESVYGAMFLKQSLENISKKMQDTLIATLKMNAIRTVQSRMMSIVGGGGGSSAQPQIVQNWKEEIYGTANKNAKVVVQDYFSQKKSDAGTAGQKIVSTGEKMYNFDPTAVKPTIDQYIKNGDISKIFDKNYTPNTAQALNDLAKMRNYPAFYAMTGQSLYAASYAQTAGSETAKNIAYQGFKGTTSSGSASGTGNITMPGSMKKDIFSEIANMPTKMVTLARSIPEVVGSLVTQMMVQMINKGFSTANSQIDKGIKTLNTQTGGSLRQIQGLIKTGVR